MRAMSSLLSSQSIAALCAPSARHIGVQVVAETGSTNADLLAQLDTLHHPMLLLAEKQTAGRGRAGRAWHSDSGVALTFSLAWKFAVPVHALMGLPLAVGVAIAETLLMFDIDARLKWPNDVLKEGKKLAGILIETALVKRDAQEELWAVIGIGINIAMPADVADTVGQPIADIPSFRQDRHRLMAAFLNHLSEVLPLFEQEGFPAFMVRWNRLDAYAGQVIAILDQGVVLHEGRALGVDRAGRLLIESAGGSVACMVGDVSLRIKENEADVIVDRCW
jgi:BirA family transcriptional regulator, biotin operon repressor / biotin---[acetyl-CoA-carboxylase] ligase